jgi:cardiolipin synthase
MRTAIEIYNCKAPPKLPPHLSAESEHGVALGLNLEPGTEDDGWIVPEPVTLTDGSTVQLYKDGEALHAAFEAIKGAKQRICLEMYIFASDDTGLAFAELLCDKARAGLRVYLIYDSFGSIATDSAMFERLKHAGVKVQEFHPFWPWEGKFSWRPLNRNHRKLLVVDNDVAWLGGLNMAGEYGGSWVVPSKMAANEFWRDNGIGIKGPVAKKFLQSFSQSWYYVTRRGRLRSAEFIYNLDGVCGACEWPIRKRKKHGRLESGDSPDNDGQLGILASAPTLHSPLRPFLNKLFREARKTISLTMAYFAPHDDLIDELCAAAKRGVNVRLMLPGRCDVQALLIAARSFYETLMTAGVRVYEREGVILHAKTMVIDGLISMIGSTNLDYRSIEYNLELSAIIRSRTLGAQMEALFENDIKYARRMTLNQWRHRPKWDRVIQWAVSRARNWL